MWPADQVELPPGSVRSTVTFASDFDTSPAVQFGDYDCQLAVIQAQLGRMGYPVPKIKQMSRWAIAKGLANPGAEVPFTAGSRGALYRRVMDLYGIDVIEAVPQVRWIRMGLTNGQYVRAGIRTTPGSKFWHAVDVRAAGWFVRNGQRVGLIIYDEPSSGFRYETPAASFQKVLEYVAMTVPRGVKPGIRAKAP